jgi:polyhydroxybutyrate depolymerase
LHGSNSGPEEQLERTGLEATADDKRFIVVAPQGSVALPSGNWAWNVPHVSAGAVDDEQFLAELVARLVAAGCVDPRKVYATGYSGGARMISQTACDRPRLFAAIATVAGLRAGAPLAADPTRIDTSTCSPSSAVPVISFSGTADPVNPYAGGGAPYWGYSAETALARWAEINDCRPRPSLRSVTDEVSVTTFRGCDGHADVVGYTVAGGGHTWPGSDVAWDPALGTVTQAIDANTLIWKFFKRQAQRPGIVAGAPP